MKKEEKVKKEKKYFYKIIYKVNSKKRIAIKESTSMKEIKKYVKTYLKDLEENYELIEIKKLTKEKEIKKELRRQRRRNKKAQENKKKLVIKEKEKIKKEKEKQKKILLKEKKKIAKEKKRKQKQYEKEIRQRKRQELILKKKQEKMLKKLEGKRIFEIVVSRTSDEQLYNKISTHITKATTTKNLDMIKERLVKAKLYTEEQIKDLFVIAKEIPADNWELVLQANKNNII